MPVTSRDETTEDGREEAAPECAKYLERCPRGRRCMTGNHVYGKLYRGFESHITNPTPKCASNRHSIAALWIVHTLPGMQSIALATRRRSNPRRDDLIGSRQDGVFSRSVRYDERDSRSFVGR